MEFLQDAKMPPEKAYLIQEALKMALNGEDSRVVIKWLLDQTEFTNADLVVWAAWLKSHQRKPVEAPMHWPKFRGRY